MRELFRKYLDNNCSPDEVKRLLAYFNIAENEVKLRRLISEWLEENEEDEEESKWQVNFHNALRLIKKQLSFEVANGIALFRIIVFQVEAKPSQLHLERFFKAQQYHSIKIIDTLINQSKLYH